MHEKPGFFEASTEVIAFILACVALMLFAMSALTARYWEAALWFGGACMIMRGLAKGEAR